MTERFVEIMARAYPKEFRGPQFTHTRNNIYEWGTNDSGKIVRKLVGQLEDVGPMRLPASEAAPLFGQTAMGLLNAVGAVSSVANLGVSIAGFAMMKRDFNRVFRRLDEIQNLVEGVADKLDTALDSLELLNLKVDYLIQFAQIQQADIEVVRQAVEGIRQFQLDQQRVEIESSLEDLADLMACRARSNGSDFQGVAERLRDHRKHLLLMLDRCAEVHPLIAETSVLTTLVAIAESHAWAGTGRQQAAQRALLQTHQSIESLFEKGYDKHSDSVAWEFARQASLHQRRLGCSWDEACVALGQSHAERMESSRESLNQLDVPLEKTCHFLEITKEFHGSRTTFSEYAASVDMTLSPRNFLDEFKHARAGVFLSEIGARRRRDDLRARTLGKALEDEVFLVRDLPILSWGVDKAVFWAGLTKDELSEHGEKWLREFPNTALSLLEQLAECLRCLESTKASFATRNLLDIHEDFDLSHQDEASLVFELISCSENTGSEKP